MSSGGLQSLMEKNMVTFEVRISHIRAAKLPKRNVFNAPDPYVIFNFDGRTFQTPVEVGSTEPSYESYSEFFRYSAGSEEALKERRLLVECYDARNKDDELLGFFSTDLWTVATAPPLHTHALEQERRKGSSAKALPLLYFEVEMTEIRMVSLSLANLHCRSLRPVSAPPAPDSSSPSSTIDLLRPSSWMNDCYVQASLRSPTGSTLAAPRRSPVCFDSLDPLWAEPDLQWALATSLRDLLGASLVLEVFHMGGPHHTAFLGAAVVPLAGCHSLQEDLPAPFRRPLVDKGHPGLPSQIEGHLYLANLPFFAQMRGGSFRDGAVSYAAPLLASCPRPLSAALLSLEPPDVLPPDPAALPPPAPPSPHFAHTDVAPLLRRGLQRIIDKWRAKASLDLTTDPRLLVSGCSLAHRLKYAYFDSPESFSLTRGLGALVCLLRASPKVEIKSSHLHLMLQCTRLLWDLASHDPLRTQELLRVVGAVPVILGLLSQYRISDEIRDTLLRVLNALSTRDSANQIAIRQAGGIPILISVLQSPNTGTGTKILVVIILRNLCYLGEPGDEEGTSHVIRYSGGIKVLVELLMASKRLTVTSSSSSTSSSFPLSPTPHKTTSPKASSIPDDDQLITQVIYTLEIILNSEDNLRSMYPMFKELLLHGHFPKVQEFCFSQLDRIMENCAQRNQDFSSLVLREVGVTPILNVISQASALPHASQVKAKALVLFDHLVAAENTFQTTDLTVEEFLPLLDSREDRVLLVAVDILNQMALQRKRVILMCTLNVITKLAPFLLRPAQSATTAPASFELALKTAQLFEKISAQSGTGSYFTAANATASTVCDFILGMDAFFCRFVPGPTADQCHQLRLSLTIMLFNLYPKRSEIQSDLDGDRLFDKLVDILAASIHPPAGGSSPALARALASCLELVTETCEGNSSRAYAHKSQCITKGLVLPLISLSTSSSPQLVAACGQLLSEICCTGSNRTDLLQLDELLIDAFDIYLQVSHCGAPGEGAQAIAQINTLGFAVTNTAPPFEISRVMPTKPTARSADAQPATTASANQQEELCAICMDAEPDTVYLQCGHMVTCYDCAQMVKGSAKPECPVCRSPIVDAIKAFFS